MVLTNIDSRGTLSTTSEITEANALYLSADISTDGNFSLSISGSDIEAIYDINSKVSEEIKTDILAFLEEVYVQAEIKRENHLSKNNNEST